MLDGDVDGDLLDRAADERPGRFRTGARDSTESRPRDPD